MKDPKFSRPKSWGFGSSVHSPRGVSSRKPFKIIGITVFGLLMIFMLMGPGHIENIPPTDSDELVRRTYEKSSSSGEASNPINVATRSSSGEASNPINVATRSSSAPSSTKRNTAFFFSPKIVNLDEQRESWWQQNPNVRAGRPKVLIVTGSQPTPCENPIDTHMYLKAAKNKVHYSRIHDLQMHYSLMEPHKDVVGSWTKLPVLRMQMLAHPEVEWLWWMDSDLIITSMDFQLPLHKYEAHNFVVYGDENRVLDLHDRTGLSTGNFLIRNCQWSLHFLDAWASMGDVHHRDYIGEFLSGSLPNRSPGTLADDQSALVYLLATEKAMWSPKIYLENEVDFTGDWMSVPAKLEQSGDSQWPVATHFTGCSRCGAREGVWPWEHCQREMERAMDYADNQVYRKYGYELRGLGIPELVPVPGHQLETVVTSPDEEVPDFKGFAFHKLPGPRVENWDAQREAWFEKNPGLKRVNDQGLPKTMIVTGSSIRECTDAVGGHGLLQALKNKVDYARFHDMPMFYGMVDFDQQLDYWWTKIPTIRVLMLAHPDVEWFWWCDGDAAVTDMVFTPPYQKFDKDGHNLVLYGDKSLLAQNDWIAVNAGVYLVRNCQWTLDLFDVWAALGTKQARGEAGVRASEVLVGRDANTAADDQSALLYMLVTEKAEAEKKWTPRIRLEREFTMSGYWKVVAPRYESMPKANKGLGGINWPWITHFAGCQPCGDREGNFDVDECRSQLKRAFGFADNQVLEQYGLVHSSLGDPEVRKLKGYEIR